MTKRMRWGYWLVAIALAGGCAATVKTTSSAAPYQAGVTYSMSAAMLAQLAASGQDIKLTIDVQSGPANGIASCVIQPMAPLGARPSLSASAATLRAW
jgi:hypothetical protein